MCWRISDGRSPPLGSIPSVAERRAESRKFPAHHVRWVSLCVTFTRPARWQLFLLSPRDDSRNSTMVPKRALARSTGIRARHTVTRICARRRTPPHRSRSRGRVHVGMFVGYRCHHLVIAVRISPSSVVASSSHQAAGKGEIRLAVPRRNRARLVKTRTSRVTHREAGEHLIEDVRNGRWWKIRLRIFLRKP